MKAWPELTFADFMIEVGKAFNAAIPLKDRGEWQDYLAANAAEVRRLSAVIAGAEREIDAIVYDLFGLDAADIALLEASLAKAA